jgi:hypothetical protein
MQGVSVAGGVGLLLISTLSTQATGSTQPPTQPVKWPGREPDPSPPSSAEIITSEAT